MRNAALILGLIGGLIGLMVGFFSWAWTDAVARYGEVDGVIEQFSDVQTIRIVSFLSPLLAIAGAGMAKTRALWGGALLLASAAGFWFGFGLNVFTLFPIGFCAVGGLMALAAGKPDEARAHF